MNDEELRDLERRRTGALVERDLELARSLHAPDYQLITPGGAAYSREAYLGEIASGALEYRVFEPASDIAVRWLGDAAAVRYRARIVVAWVGGSEEGLYWHTDLWERTADGWQAVWSHATQIPASA